MQDMLELNDFDMIDEYGLECNFKPKYEYSQLFIELYNDKNEIPDFEVGSLTELLALF
ncbi:MAG: hypothetical protein K2H13_06485 [Eubacterium sp.]|nr:hypothetical protein [Eubacterium sp.]MDE6155058.1 hypothetical protein [Eubacterium sp.]MDE6767976.1 hypothetical protein [Eubacterium sp.]